jgi:hypothetical protein
MMPRRRTLPALSSDVISQAAERLGKLPPLSSGDVAVQNDTRVLDEDPGDPIVVSIRPWKRTTSRMSLSKIISCVG